MITFAKLVFTKKHLSLFFLLPSLLLGGPLYASDLENAASNRASPSPASGVPSPRSVLSQGLREHWRGEMEKGSVRATYEYAMMLKNGVGGPQDLETALQLFLARGEEGDAESGNAYFDTLLAQGEREQAISWLRDMAEDRSFRWAQKRYGEEVTYEELDKHEILAYLLRTDWDKYTALGCKVGGVAGVSGAQGDPASGEGDDQKDA